MIQITVTHRECIFTQHNTYVFPLHVFPDMITLNSVEALVLQQIALLVKLINELLNWLN